MLSINRSGLAFGLILVFLIPGTSIAQAGPAMGSGQGQPGQQVGLSPAQLDPLQVQAAESRIFDYIERGTGRKIAEPGSPEARHAVQRHLALLAELDTKSVETVLPDGTIVVQHGMRHAMGMRMVDGPDGILRLECVSVRDFLLGRAPDFRFGNSPRGGMRQ